jgi:rsbT co-antagonist protein RsbR
MSQEDSDLVTARSEIAALRGRVDELESERNALREQLAYIRRIVGVAPLMIYVFDAAERRDVYSTRQLTELLGYAPEDLLQMGSSVLGTVMHPDDEAEMTSHLVRVAKAADGEFVEHTYRMRHKNGEWRWFRSRETAFARGADGALQQVLGGASDITGEIEGEAERAAQRERLIQAQQDALRELSTPLIPIADEVIAMPLIGTIDSARAAQILEVLLNGITAQAAAVAILDITGVRVVDSQVADALIRVAKAARLLGADVVLTGISPAIAQTLVELGAELSGVVTRGNFQSGIAYALGVLKQRAVLRGTARQA